MLAFDDGRCRTEANLGYCAGVIDSDGYIGVKRSTYGMRVLKDRSQPVFSERVAVKQVQREAVDLLRDLFGGCLYLGKPQCKNGKPLWCWQVTDLKALLCLTAVLPHLRIKKAQAENCLALRGLKEQSKLAKVAFGRGHRGAATRPATLTAAMETTYATAKTLNAVGRRAQG